MWIKTSLAMFAALIVAGCNGPSPAFRGLPAQTVKVGPSVFDIRRQGNHVELLRTNAEYAPNFASIIPRATQAVMIATGCTPRPTSWEGEQTLMQVQIDCPTDRS